MSEKLYEYTAFCKFAVVIAAKNLIAANKKIEELQEYWFLHGEFLNVSDIELVNVRKPKSSDLDDEAHLIIYGDKQ